MPHDVQESKGEGTGAGEGKGEYQNNRDHRRPDLTFLCPTYTAGLFTLKKGVAAGSTGPNDLGHCCRGRVGWRFFQL